MDDYEYDEFLEFKSQNDQNKLRKEKAYKDNSKRRLLNNIKKKFDTTIIGSLAAFEEKFGDDVIIKRKPKTIKDFFNG